MKKNFSIKKFKYRTKKFHFYYTDKERLQVGQAQADIKLLNNDFL